MAKKQKYDDSSMVSITSDRDRVIKRPTMYIPTTDVDGALHIMYEIIDNAIDEIDADKTDTKKGDSITVIFDEKTKQLTVTDNGRGIPQATMYDTCTVLNSSGKMDNTEDTAYEFSGGTNGVGLKLSVFLSKTCSITSMRDGKALTYYFEDGILVDEKREKTKDRGTVVSFKLNPKHVDVNEITSDMIKDRLEEKAYLFPDIKIKLIFIRGEKETGSYSYRGKTIIDRVKKFKPDTDIIHIETSQDVKILDKFDDKKLKVKPVIVDVAFALCENAVDGSQDDFIIAYGNNIKNYTGGTHVEGLKEGVIKYFRQNVLEKLNNKKGEDFQIIPSDITSGICGFIQVKVHTPIFRGQYKDQLSNQEVKFAVRDAVCEALENEKTQVVKKYVDFVKNVARGRIASKKVRKKDVSNAYSKDKINKYSPILRSVHTTHPELIIVEGDSAAGCAIAGADKYNQAIYSTSRPTNLIDADINVVMKAKTAFNDIIDICGIELGKNCDVSKSQIDHIWIMTDADCDGDVIAISILGLIAKHCPDLIINNMVGRIVPPAYSFKENGKTIFVSSQAEFFKRVMKRFSKESKLFKWNRQMTEDDILRFLTCNFDYKDKLENLANRYKVSPELMEWIALNYKKNEKVSYWKKLFSKYQDITVSKDGDGILIDGSIDNDYIRFTVDQYFDNVSLKFRTIMRRNLVIYGFQLNKETDLSIYEVMCRFSKYMPKDITRYKGLGDMNAKDLAKLCMDVNNRTVKIFKFDEIKDDLNKIHIMLSGKQAFLAARSDILMNRVADDMEIDT